MLEIKIKDGESVERAIRRFKRKVDSEGVLKDLKKRSHYEKPSTKRREQKKAAKYKAKMRSKYEDWYHNG